MCFRGVSVYYKDLVLVRAALMTRSQYLDKLAGRPSAAYAAFFT